MADSLAIGDVLEITCPGGVAYMAYAGREASMGDAIWLVPKVYAAPTDAWTQIFAGKGYFVFYPAHTALRRKLVRKVGYSTDAIRPLPSKQRSVVNRDEGGRVTRWLISEGRNRVPRRDEDLDEFERNLPIADIWNHPYLIDAIERGYVP